MARLGLANVLTLSRFALAPVFALVFGAAVAFPAGAVIFVTALWVLLLVIELTDVLDGAVARRSDSVSDLGKIMDPFADVVSKVTYFACLLAAGILPLWFLLVVLYREFGIILIRMIMYRDGTALGAKSAGKLKTWFYALTSAAGLLQFSAWTLGVSIADWFDYVIIGLIILTALLSVVSFAQYFVAFVRHRQARA